jgi:stage V sporulation protein D (sporulation-specific penicillin-binding protein)
MDKILKRNTLFIRIVFFLLVALLIAQLFRIQVVENTKWSTRSELRNKIHKTFKGARGKVFFADGSDLATNELAYGVAVLPDGFREEGVIKSGITPAKFSEEISKITNVDKESLQKRIEADGAKYVVVKNNLDRETLDKISSVYPMDLGIWMYEEQSKRVYPNKQLASKIIGFVQKDAEGNDVGQYGIEQKLDGLLQGTEGVLIGERDSSNQVILNQNFENINAKNGVDVTLTIDKGIQAMLEETLMQYVDKYKAKEGTVVIMEPNTGRIIAMANLPSYDPNVFWEGEVVTCPPKYEYYLLHEKCNAPKEEVKTEEKKDNTQVFYPDGYEERLKQIEEEQKKLKEEEARLKAEADAKTEKKEEIDPRIAKYPPLVQQIFRKKSLPEVEVFRNAANSFTYEPGSVVKVITLAIAYDKNKIPRDGNYALGGHNGCQEVLDAKLCTADRKAKPSLSVKEMLANSDNVGALRVAQTVGITEFANTLVKFGLSRSTDIELADESVFKIKPIDQWTRVDQATASYGQGSVAFTPIQLTNAWNILASGGKSYKPTIIKEINDNGTIKTVEPKFIEQVISEDAANAALTINATPTSSSIKKARDFYQKYPFTGKTGTANVPKLNSAGYEEFVVNTSYLGSAPLQNPRFTMLVWFREPRLSNDGFPPGGGNTAQVAWLDIAEKLMMKMNVVPENAR